MLPDPQFAEFPNFNPNSNDFRSEREMAYSAVISLMNTISRFLIHSNQQLTRSVYEELSSLRETLKRLDGGRKRSMDRKVIRDDWSMIDVLDGKNYRDVDWSMISAMFESNGGNSRSNNRSAISRLDAEIRDAVWKLEDVLQSQVRSLSLSLPPASLEILNTAKKLINEYIRKLPFIQEEQMGVEVEQEMDSFLKMVKNLEKKYIRELCTPLPRGEDEAVVPPIDDFCGEKSTAVGLSDQIEQIRNELLDFQSGPEVVSLFGMAGIGKTRLAREICQHPAVVRAFHFIALVSIGPSNEMEDILADVVAQIQSKPRDVYVGEDRYTLAMLLQKCLHGRRYLIVLDDIWSTEVCDYLIGWLPTSGNGRLLVKTRQGDVAEFRSARIHQMRFLNDEESWNLLWQSVFGGESYPPQLEKLGRKIAHLCEGLPLLILTIAHILCGFEKTEEFWKKVADIKGAYERIEKVLISSYEYLPQHLKPCFLYMGVFPQTCEIRLSKLINLWDVEDFFEPWVQDLEESAMECMKGLVSKSLAIICKQSSSHRIKSSKLHSAYWHLCVKEAWRIKFFHVLNKLIDASEDYIQGQRRLSIQNNILLGIKEAYDCMDASTARSLLCTGEDHEYPVPICLNSMLLRVLDALSVRLYEFPEEVVKLLLLRYLALTHNGKLPSSISKLHHLEFLIVSQHHNIKFVRDSRPEKWWKLQRDSTCLPKEIWDMQRLKHLWIKGRNLPKPSYHAELPNLSTLRVNAHSCSDAVFRRIPNLKKLGIQIELQPIAAGSVISCFKHMGLLDQLESLKCAVVNPHLRPDIVAPPRHLSNLPMSLKKLSLNGIGYSWKYMSAIGSLPNLKVLKLRCSAFQGPEWRTGAGQFSSLEILLLEDIDVVEWTIHRDNGEDNGLSPLRRLIFYFDCFQSLQRLTIRHCFKLREIPPKIGDIQTLETMEVEDCSPSVVASAQQIQKKRSSLQVGIKSSWNFR